MSSAWRAATLADIPDGGARRFTRGARSVLLARRGGRLFAYDNECPHAFTPLDSDGERLLSVDGLFLQCSTHGAQFRFEDGVCILGPCRGRRLRPLPVCLEGDAVIVDMR